MNAKEKITKARAGLILDMPFFGSLSLRLQVKEDETCKTAYTDGRILGFNPSFIDGLPLEQVKGLICHEVMHCACSHHTRRANRDAKKWNIAADYAINQILVDSNVSLPSGRLLDPTYKDMSADEIYSRLPKEEDQNDNPDNDPGNCGEIRDAQNDAGNPASQSEMNQSEQDWKIALTQANQQAKAMGKLPGGIARLVESLVEPIVDWREILRRFVDKIAKNDYSWSRPNRRFIGQGLYLPSLHSEQIGPIVVACDTSGSVDDEMINQFAAELTSILQDYKTECTVIYCDSAIQGIETFTQDDLPLKLNAKGGGGTNFNPPFEYIAENNIIPSCMIYLTDMAGRFPDNPPDYPVLWGMIEAWTTEAPFGECVKIK